MCRQQHRQREVAILPLGCEDSHAQQVQDRCTRPLHSPHDAVAHLLPPLEGVLPAHPPGGEGVPRVTGRSLLCDLNHSRGDFQLQELPEVHDHLERVQTQILIPDELVPA